MNWGHGIAIVYGLFVAGMLVLVVASTRHDPGLITKDYYNLDIHYQAHFDKKQNTAALSTAPQVRFDAAARSVHVVFPDNLPVSKGTVQFRQTSSSRNDFRVDIPAVKPNEVLQIPVTDIPGGRWLLDLDWESNGRAYFYATAVAVEPA
jgi:nitrogen fixation protein FixH